MGEGRAEVNIEISVTKLKMPLWRNQKKERKKEQQVGGAFKFWIVSRF